MRKIRSLGIRLMMAVATAGFLAIEAAPWIRN